MIINVWKDESAYMAVYLDESVRDVLPYVPQEKFKVFFLVEVRIIPSEFLPTQFEYCGKNFVLVVQDMLGSNVFLDTTWYRLSDFDADDFELRQGRMDIVVELNSYRFRRVIE